MNVKVSNRDLQDLCGRIIELLQEKTKSHRTQGFDKHSLFEEARRLPYYFLSTVRILPLRTLFIKYFLEEAIFYWEIDPTKYRSRLEVIDVTSGNHSYNINSNDKMQIHVKFVSNNGI